ncbi:MAG: mandelate racemase/muconate lactonizing enzyme family protein, partial [Chitinophagales bacterium]
SRYVHEHSFDLLQADHTLSGIDISLWDLLGKKLNEPVYRLLGYRKAFPKIPYASQLFGETAAQTLGKAGRARSAGYKAVKFGWGPFGRNALADDIAQLSAAREGIGEHIWLMIDAGTIWKEDLQLAARRLPALQKVAAYWLEEPFTKGALDAYKTLSVSEPIVSLAAGEGCNNFIQAQTMMIYGGLKYIQIDAGRIGGITAAKAVADLAQEMGITYVNHTFTSHLALSASLQPFAGIEKDFICEYPVELSPLAEAISRTKIKPDQNGYLNLPDEPGLGISVDTAGLKKYLVELEIKIKGKLIYSTPVL